MIDLLKEYPPMIANPITGRKVLVRWWTPDEQNHVIISDSEDEAYDTYSFLARKHPKIKFIDLWDVTIINCTPRIALQQAKTRYENEFEQFKHLILYELNRLQPEGWNDLNVFGFCNHINEDECYDCHICDGYDFYFLSEEIAKSFFNNDDVRFSWRKEYNSHTDNKYQKALIEELENKDLEVIQAVPDFGHHREGVKFVNSSYLYENCLFYFQGAEVFSDESLSRFKEHQIAYERKIVMSKEESLKEQDKRNEFYLQESKEAFKKIIGLK